MLAIIYIIVFRSLLMFRNYHQLLFSGKTLPNWLWFYWGITNRFNIIRSFRKTETTWKIYKTSTHLMIITHGITHETHKNDDRYNDYHDPRIINIRIKRAEKDEIFFFGEHQVMREGEWQRDLNKHCVTVIIILVIIICFMLTSFNRFRKGERREKLSFLSRNNTFRQYWCRCSFYTPHISISDSPD